MATFCDLKLYVVYNFSIYLYGTVFLWRMAWIVFGLFSSQSAENSRTEAYLNIGASLILSCCLATLLLGAAGRWISLLHVSTCVRTAKDGGLFRPISSVLWIAVTQDPTANWGIHCSCCTHFDFLSFIICSELGAREIFLAYRPLN